MSLRLNACPAFTLEDSSYNEMKKSGLKVYNNVLNHINILSERLIEKTYKKKNMTDLSRAYLVFKTTISNWLNFMPKSDNKTAWEKSLIKFKERLAKIYEEINYLNIPKAEKELKDFKIDFILFYQWNPIDTARTALQTKNETILNQCIMELKELKDLPEHAAIFFEKIKNIDINDEQDIKKQLEWQKKNNILLKKEFGEYFEKNSQL